MRLLLLGGTGQIGKAFRALPFPTNVDVVAPSRTELDLLDSKAIAHVVSAAPPSAVINAAAYTEVDQAKSEAALIKIRRRPIHTCDHPTPAVRPVDPRLDCTAMVRAFGTMPRPGQALSETIDTILTRKDFS